MVNKLGAFTKIEIPAEKEILIIQESALA